MRSFLHSSVGKKAVVAVTGLLLLGFVIMHLAGNLSIFLGPEALNAYAAKLRHFGWLLWVARIGLLLVVTVHIVLAIVVTRENRAARPIPYEVSRAVDTTLAARTMMISGLLLAVFIGYHLLHFTFHVVHAAEAHRVDSLGRHDVFSMVVLSFQDPVLVAWYVMAMAILSSHLHHGIGSWLQSLGLTNERFLPAIRRIAGIVAWLIFLGYSAIPVAILAGVVRGRS